MKYHAITPGRITAYGDGPTLHLRADESDQAFLLRVVGTLDPWQVMEFVDELRPDYERAGSPHGGSIRGILQWGDERMGM